MFKIIGVVGGIFSLTTILGFIVWMIQTMANPTPENMNKGGELIAQAIIPWWVPVIQFLAPLGLIGAILVVVVLFVVTRK